VWFKTILFPVALLCWLVAPAPSRAGFIVSLGSPTLSGTVESFTVTLDYEPTTPPSWKLALFAIDVSLSSSKLTNGGKFTAFSFTPAGPFTVGGGTTQWNQSLVFGNSGNAGETDFASNGPAGDVAPNAPGHPYTLGTLSLDLSKAGVSTTDPTLSSLFVKFAPSDLTNFKGTAIGEEYNNDTSTFQEAAVTFATQQQFLATPGGGGGPVVPAPPSLVLAALGGGLLLIARRRRQRVLQRAG
jgi:hypothetical protein